LRSHHRRHPPCREHSPSFILAPIYHPYPFPSSNPLPSFASKPPAHSDLRLTPSHPREKDAPHVCRPPLPLRRRELSPPPPSSAPCPPRVDSASVTCTWSPRHNPPISAGPPPTPKGCAKLLAVQRLPPMGPVSRFPFPLPLLHFLGTLVLVSTFSSCEVSPDRDNVPEFLVQLKPGPRFHHLSPF